jgi:hypothetical protein
VGIAHIATNIVHLSFLFPRLRVRYFSFCETLVFSLFTTILKHPFSMEIIHAAPVHSSFIPLSEHQSQTPTSFYSGPAVLYHHSDSSRIVILSSELHASPGLLTLADSPTGNGPLSNGNTDAAHQADEVVIDGVDIWVTSE